MSEPVGTGDAIIDTPAPAGAVETPAPEADDSGKFGEHAGYIKELRGEAAKYRTAAKPYEDAFGQYAEEDRAVWFDLAKTLAENPAAAAVRFEELAAKLKEAYPGEKTPTAEELKGAAGEPAEADKPMTRAQMDAYMTERQQAADQEAAVKSITSEVAAVYPAGTSEHREVLWLAANETGGDIKAALAKMETKRQAIVDQYLTGKKEKAGVRPVSASGEPSGEARPIQTFKDARAAVLARINAAQA